MVYYIHIYMCFMRNPPQSTRLRRFCSPGFNFEPLELQNAQSHSVAKVATTCSLLSHLCKSAPAGQMPAAGSKLTNTRSRILVGMEFPHMAISCRSVTTPGAGNLRNLHISCMRLDKDVIPWLPPEQNMQASHNHCA